MQEIYKKQRKESKQNTTEKPPTYKRKHQEKKKGTENYKNNQKTINGNNYISINNYFKYKWINTPIKRQWKRRGGIYIQGNRSWPKKEKTLIICNGNGSRGYYAK